MMLLVGGRRYPVVHIERVPIIHVLRLQDELASNPHITSVRSWRQIRQLWDDYGTLSNEEKLAHPESVFLTALMMWAARVCAGEDITLLDAADVPFDSAYWIREPGDLTEDAGEGEGKASSPRRAAADGGRPGHKAKAKRKR